MGQSKIRIVRLEDPREFVRTEKVQRDAWGIEQPESVIPFHIMIAAQHHGGLVLGAYEGRKMVGCLFGFSAYNGKRPYHYSHITGVLRSRQRNGVGFLLKQAQRKYALFQGYDLVRWTYDPLQAGNAYFNIHKLGAMARTYRRNLYGPMPDRLNRGMVSDRFEAEWWIRSRRVKEHVEDLRTKNDGGKTSLSTVALANKTRREANVRVPIGTSLKLKENRLLVEIPESIQRVKQYDIRLAKKWTLHARKLFEAYFGTGYAATDVMVDHTKEGNRVYYLLEKMSKL